MTKLYGGGTIDLLRKYKGVFIMRTYIKPRQYQRILMILLIAVLLTGCGQKSARVTSAPPESTPGWNNYKLNTETELTDPEDAEKASEDAEQKAAKLKALLEEPVIYADYDSDDFEELSHGWYERTEGWYYFDENLRMLTGWQSIDGEVYCLADDGLMLSDIVIDDFYLNKDGKLRDEIPEDFVGERISEDERHDLIGQGVGKVITEDPSEDPAESSDEAKLRESVEESIKESVVAEESKAAESKAATEKARQQAEAQARATAEQAARAEAQRAQEAAESRARAEAESKAAAEAAISEEPEGKADSPSEEGTKQETQHQSAGNTSSSSKNNKQTEPETFLAVDSSGIPQTMKRPSDDD